MMKIYMLAVLLAGFNASYSMEKEPAKPEYVEDTRPLRQDGSLYFSLLPKDILGMVQYYRLVELIKLKIAQAGDYKGALDYIKALAAGEYAELFNSPTFIDKFISSISSKFGKDPAEVARDINTHGTSLWLTHIRPNQVKLLQAAERGDLDINTVQQLIAAGVNVNASDNFGWTALMLAAGHGHVKLIKTLIAAGVNVNAQTPYGTTALMRAASNGQIELVKLLIDSRANVNAQSASGWTALIQATCRGRTEAVKMLIKAGANVNARNNFSKTALMEAACSGRTEIVKILIDAGADVNARDKDGDTVLDLAQEEGYKDIIKLLKQNAKK